MKVAIPTSDGIKIIDKDKNRDEYINAMGMDQYIFEVTEEALEIEDTRLRRIKRFILLAKLI